MQVLQKALDGATARHQAIAHNMANINTSGYKKLEVNFQNQLKAAVDKSSASLTTTHSRHISNKPSIKDVQPETTRSTATSMRPDGNNVDIDQEMTKMAANIFYFNSAVSQLNKRISLLKHIISEGRR